MILPIAFIPTPRRLLLAILFVLSALVVVTGIMARVSILRNPQQPTYLSWYTTQSTLSIIFSNLPFMTSLVVTAAPARTRHLSSQLVLSSWPRSRRGSWACTDFTPPLRTARFNSTTSTMTEITSPTDLEKAEASCAEACEVTQKGERLPMGSAICEAESPRDSAVDDQEGPALPSPPAVRPETRDGQVPKMRLSGGLAEMGELSLHDTTQGWPIYWR
jgi:hypothetical protein